jgi:pimeloyl-ACP methyl ester carboxylesterase
MAGGMKAFSHSRRGTGGLVRLLGLGLVGLMIFSASFAIVSWMAYRFIQPPPPKICGTPNGPPVTAPRVQLRDGRFLAYKEAGVQKQNAKYTIISVHGYGGSRHSMLGGLSEQLMVELRIRIIAIDRAGYGQSTPFLQRSIKSDAYDVQDLADGLELGPTFYVAATSIGGYTGYGLIKYLPHRLAGIAMFAPVINFWWTGFPPQKARAAFAKQVIGDRLALRVAHYAPWLVHWYMTQTIFPTSTTVRLEKDAEKEERERLSTAKWYSKVHTETWVEPTQQGKDESQYHDMRIMFGRWDFEPFELENPFATRKGAVHIWQGDNDYLVPVVLQREVAKALPWVQYHEVPKAGHSLLGIPGQADIMIRALLQE